MPRIVAINYADAAFSKAQRLNAASAKRKGKADEVIPFTNEDIDAEFSQKNERILSCKRGGGLWLWKPYVIQKQLALMEYGDYLVYSDAGSIYIGSVRRLIEHIKTDVGCFRLSDPEKMYTKRAVFEALDAQGTRYTDTPQILATFIVLKKTDFSVRFVDEWLQLCCQAELIDDSCLDTEDPCFIAHRNDQSLFSLLCKKYEIEPHRDPSASRGFMDKHGVPCTWISTRAGNHRFARKTLRAKLNFVARSIIRSNRWLYNAVKRHK